MKKLLILFSILTYSLGQGLPDEIKLVKVDVDGNIITSENTIIFTAGLRKGQTISPSDFPRAVKRLWQLGLFRDIQIR